MSQENVELAYELIEAVKSQDTSRLLELTDPEVEWYSRRWLLRRRQSGEVPE